MSDPNNPPSRKSLIVRIWNFLWHPSSRFSLATLLIVGGIGGIIFWGSFNWAMELTNTEAFCISCHEMRDNVYKELQQTIHFKNRSGVRATLLGLSRSARMVLQGQAKDPGLQRSPSQNSGHRRHAGKIRTAPARARPARLGFDESELIRTNAAIVTRPRRWTRTSNPRPPRKSWLKGSRPV